MPIYEFKCLSCGHRFEQLCRMGEDGAGLLCPKCGESGPKRCQSTFFARSASGGGGRSSLGGSGCAPT
jgi:putative FmdB family regulatory protein